MNEIIAYFIQSGINLAILFGIYWMFLRRDTFYQLNRYYLMISLIASFLFPLMKISISGSAQAEYIYMLEPIVIAPQVVAEQVQNNISLGNILLLIYLAGSGFFMVRFVHQVFRINLLIKQYGVIRYKGLKLVVVDEDYVPFSMFNMVFIQRSIFNKPGLDKILEHEKAHVLQYHTIDLVVLELFVILQWFNPFVWMTRRSLKSIHEYLADRSVLSKGYNRGEYKQLLLSQTLGAQFIPLSNKFNQSLTKKRFIMMSKKRTHGINLIKMVLIIPAAIALSIVLTISFTGNVIAGSGEPGLSAASISNETSSMAEIVPQEEPVYTVVEVMPKYPGGQDALMRYMSTNTKYPENARKNGVQGTVFITFVVEKDGQISNARVLRGVDEELDKEALRVVKEMPKWNPGKEKGKAVNVQFNLPVAFKLDSGKEKEAEKAETPQRYQEIKKIDK